MWTGRGRPACATSRHIGLRLAADVGARRLPSSPRRHAPRSPALAHSANSDGPDPDRLQPSAPASAAARLISGQAGHERARACGSAIVSSSERPISAKSDGVQAVHERAEVRPLLDRVGERDRVAEQRPRLGGLDFEIGMHDHRRQPRRHRQPDDVGRIRRGGPARSRRRSHGAMLSACADPAPSRSPSSAQAISVSTDDVGAEQRIDRDHRSRGAGGAAAEAARQRQALPDA